MLFEQIMAINTTYYVRHDVWVLVVTLYKTINYIRRVK